MKDFDAPGQDGAFSGDLPSLSNDDQRLLDRLIDNGFDRDALGALSDDESRRVETLMNLFGLMDDYPVEDADSSLIHATMLRIDREVDSERDRMRVESRPDDRRRWAMPFRLPDLITVAAVLLIGTSIIVPVLGAMNRSSIDRGCANNLRAMGEAFHAYTTDFNGAMPTSRASIAPDIGWEQVRNLLNLTPMFEGGYCEHKHCSCPGHQAHDEFGPSYSYQLPGSGQAVRWQTGPRTVILGDRNPLIDAARAGRFDVPPLSISINHRGRGQNVLQSDNAIEWLTEPTIGQDNIWLPDGFQRLEDGALPTRESDTFLAH